MEWTANSVVLPAEIDFRLLLLLAGAFQTCPQALTMFITFLYHPSYRVSCTK